MGDTLILFFPAFFDHFHFKLFFQHVFFFVLLFVFCFNSGKILILQIKVKSIFLKKFCFKVFMTEGAWSQHRPHNDTIFWAWRRFIYPIETTGLSLPDPESAIYPSGVNKFSLCWESSVGCVLCWLQGPFKSIFYVIFLKLTLKLNSCDMTVSLRNFSTLLRRWELLIKGDKGWEYVWGRILH